MSEASRWQDYFTDGETLLWEGAPVKYASASPYNLFISAFGVPFFLAGLGMMGGGLIGAFASGGGLAGFGGGFFIFFFGIPFACVGAGLVFGPWYMLANAHRKIRYALSNRRAYIATQWWTRKMETYDWRATDMLELDEGRRASSVYFTAKTLDDSTKRIGFEHIAEARRVFDLIREGRENRERTR